MIGLIGLGVVGAPIAHKLYQWNSERFTLIASGEIRKDLESQELTINGDKFQPQIVSDKAELKSPLKLLLICVKNFQLNDALKDIKNVVTDETVILPLENGISAYKLLKEQFPNNAILEGYVQGPNTDRVANGFVYQNSGVVHMGSSKTQLCDYAIQSYLLLKEAKVSIVYEAEIRRMVWSKWMLNTAGNTVTAVLGASYADFKNSTALQNLCRKLMQEFVLVAQAEHIYLNEQDIESTIQYFVTYNGEKRTSMLEDVINRRMTENEYITGELLKIAKQNAIAVPMNETMYLLVKAKESLYLINRSTGGGEHSN